VEEVVVMLSVVAAAVQLEAVVLFSVVAEAGKD